MSVSYIFLFSRNNSGTTAMSQFISESITDSYLPPYGNREGQFAPRVKDIMRKDPWDNKSKFDWILIKKKWKPCHQNNKKIFIEASSPNIIRAPEILETFKDSAVIFSISSPYSYVPSCIFNYGIRDNFNKDFNYFMNSCVYKWTKEWAEKAKQQHRAD